MPTDDVITNMWRDDDDADDDDRILFYVPLIGG